MTYKVRPEYKTLKVGEDNELPDNSFIYAMTAIGTETIQVLLMCPPTEDDALKAMSADIAWRLSAQRVK